jgi:hypothetical protein
MESALDFGSGTEGENVTVLFTYTWSNGVGGGSDVRGRLWFGALPSVCFLQTQKANRISGSN